MMRLHALTLLAFAAPIAVHAQQWRTLDVSRQLHDTGDQRVHVQYGAGRLDIRPTSDPVLYTMHLRYDEDHARPVHRYSVDGRSLTVGLTDQTVHWRHMDSHSMGELQLGLSRSVPMRLELETGAGTSDIDLGGLAVRDLQIRTGASASTLTFTSPNTTRLRSFDVDAGAASFEATLLANANTQDVRVKTGVGTVTLDFGGDWSQDIAVDADVALGKIAMHVPSDVGIRVEAQRVLASFSHPGLYKRGNAWYSDNWESAKYKLRVHVQTVFGAIEIDRRSRMVVTQVERP